MTMIIHPGQVPLELPVAGRRYNRLKVRICVALRAINGSKVIVGFIS